MPEPYGYTGGTITLTSGSTAVTGALTAWADLLPGDEIEVAGVRGVVDVVVSNTSLTLRAAWGGATYTGTSYVVLYRSSTRHDVSRLSERFARWYRDAVYVINTNGNTPASSSAAGTTGDQCWDANYLYVCVATNTWKRVAISTW